MGTKMFKIGGFEAELAKSMETNLVSNKLENKYSFDKIAKVVDYLNAASEMLDDTGFHDEAEVLTVLLEKIAGGGLKKKFNLETTAAGFGDLSKEDMEFYKGLAPHHKERVHKLIKKDPAAKSTDLSDFVDEIKKMRINSLIGEELGKGTQEIPDVVEMTSLPPQSMPKSDPQLGDQIIDIKSLAEAIQCKSSSKCPYCHEENGLSKTIHLEGGKTGRECKHCGAITTKKEFQLDHNSNKKKV